MYKTHFKLYFYIIWLGILTPACHNDGPVQQYKYSIPEQTEDGWIVGSTNDAGLNTEILVDMMNYIHSMNDHNIHSILIFRNDLLVFEEYFAGYLYSVDPPGSNGAYIIYDREVDHYLASISKSITSVIFGAAVLNGYIENIDDKIVDLMPEYSNILTGDKGDITLHHLLTMSSGLAWDESSYSYDDPRNNVIQLFIVEDPIEYTLSLPLLYSPGEEFLYNSGGTNVLGAIIQKSSGMRLIDFANTYLFEPLNVEGGSWQQLGEHYLFASGGLFLRPRELAKIGSLFLNNGYWEGHQIISEHWIAESVRNQIITKGRTLPLAHGYGYQWWLQDYQVNGIVYNSFLAAGWGDQYMIIFPEQNMMVLFNGGNYLSSGSISPFDLVQDYILRAL